MTDETPRVRFEEIPQTPASQLLKLSFVQLDKHIAIAQANVNANQTMIEWLRGIKIEKTFRENPDLVEMGGEA